MARVTLKPAEIDLVGLRKFLKRQTQHGIVQHTESAVEMVICTQKDVFSHSHIFNQIPFPEANTKAGNAVSIFLPPDTKRLSHIVFSDSTIAWNQAGEHSLEKISVAAVGPKEPNGFAST